MSWRAKVAAITQLGPEWESRLLPWVRIPDAGYAAPMIEQVQSKFPFASEQYLICLEQFGGIQLGPFVMPEYEDIEEHLWALLEDIIDFAKYVPIARDMGGGFFALGKDGAAYWKGSLLREESLESIATDFDEMLDRVVMGPEHYKIRAWGPSSDWYDFLRSQGWA